MRSREGQWRSKPLHPGQKGTQRLLKEYGDHLASVRYRYDKLRPKRLKTAELIVDEQDWLPGTHIPLDQRVLLRIEHSENEWRERGKSHGGYWNPDKKDWQLSLNKVLALGLEKRMLYEPGFSFIEIETALNSCQGARMEIINYMPKYAHEIADLFHDSVHEIGRSYYSKEEIEAWAPTPPDYEKWSVRLKNKKPYMAVQNSKVLGFIELENNGHIDGLYTHKDFQRCGVARNLYLHLEKEAKAKGIKMLYVEASHIAKPFFENQNFKLVKENTVVRNGVKLTNFKMEKGIAP